MPFRIYPNPSHGIFRLLMNDYIGAVNCTVTNANGNTVFEREFVSVYAPLLLDLSAQAKGVYFLRIETGKDVFTEKLVVL
jgi:hypothetical protein